MHNALLLNQRGAVRRARINAKIGRNILLDVGFSAHILMSRSIDVE
jgi:hypothetical protein